MAGKAKVSQIQYPDGTVDDPPVYDTPAVVPGAAPADADGNIAPWITSGVRGSLSELRSGVATHGSSLMDDYAIVIAAHIADGTADPAGAVAAVVPEVDVGITDVRYIYSKELPLPSRVAEVLRPVRQWPMLLTAPTAVVLGVGYLRAVTGEHVIVTVCRRHVAPRAKRSA